MKWTLLVVWLPNSVTDLSPWWLFFGTTSILGRGKETSAWFDNSTSQLIILGT
jgi:hypothetical protein